jgi:outer membrane protein
MMARTERRLRNNLGLLLAAIFCSTVSQAAETLNLEQAIALALDNNRGIRTSAIDIEKAKDRLAATRTRQFPAFSVYMLGAQQLRSFDFTLEKGVLGAYEATGPMPSEDVHLKTPLAPTGVMTVQVKQSITSLIRVRRNMEALKTGVAIATEQTRAERQKIAREVKRVYYGLHQIESSLRTVRETAKLYEEIEALTSRYVVQQVALKVDLLQTRARLAKAQQLEVHLKNQQAAAKEQLNQMLGRDVLTEFDVQPVLEVTGDTPDLEEARAKAMQNRPEIRHAALRQVQAYQDYRAKKAEYIPDVAAEFNNLSFMNWGRYMPTQTMSVGVSLTWEPFDWGRRKHEAAEKARTIEQMRIQQKDVEAQVSVDLNDKYRQLRYRRAELRVARLSQEAELENVRITKAKYSLQAVLLKDVLQAQASLEESNSDYQSALTAFWNARADYERAIGDEL